MKTVNVKSGSLVATNKRPMILNEGDRAPCHYAKIERDEKRKDWKWTIGCKYFGAGKDEEYCVKMAKLGDVDDENTWLRITGKEFAIELISLFKDGGELAVKNWVKGGCP